MGKREVWMEREGVQWYAGFPRVVSEEMKNINGGAEGQETFKDVIWQ